MSSSPRSNEQHPATTPPSATLPTFANSAFNAFNANTPSTHFRLKTQQELTCFPNRISLNTAWNATSFRYRSDHDADDLVQYPATNEEGVIHIFRGAMSSNFNAKQLFAYSLGYGDGGSKGGHQRKCEGFLKDKMGNNVDCKRDHNTCKCLHSYAHTAVLAKLCTTTLFFRQGCPHLPFS